MKKKTKKNKVRRAALLLLFFVGVFWYFEGPGSRPPAWWRTPMYWPHASGPVRWRVVAPLVKLSGNLPELGWGELWDYAGKTSGDGESSGFVELVRHSGDSACPTLWSTPFGELWGRSTDGGLLEFLVVEQLIDRIYDNRSVRVEPGDVVVDVGGHLGVYTLFALTKGAGKVVVLEPEPTNLACFKKSFADAIRDEKVLLVEAAAWDEPGVLSFDVPGETNTGAGRVDGGDEESDILFAGTIEVPAVTIDDVVAELGLDRVDLIKMDIEGAEREALTGARDTMARFGPRLALCTYHNAEDREALTRIALDARPSYRVKAGRHHAFIY